MVERVELVLVPDRAINPERARVAHEGSHGGGFALCRGCGRGGSSVKLIQDRKSREAGDCDDDDCQSAGVPRLLGFLDLCARNNTSSQTGLG